MSGPAAGILSCMSDDDGEQAALFAMRAGMTCGWNSARTEAMRDEGVSVEVGELLARDRMRVGDCGVCSGWDGQWWGALTMIVPRLSTWVLRY